MWSLKRLLKKWKVRIWFLVCLGLAVGAGAWYAENAWLRRADAWRVLLSQAVAAQSGITLVGHIDGYVKTTSWGEQAPFQVSYYLTSGDEWVPAPGSPRIWLTVYEQAGMILPLESGEAFKASVKLQMPLQGSFAESLKRKGIDLEGVATYSTLVKVPSQLPIDLFVWQGLAQNWMETRVTMGYGVTAAAYLLSFSVGDHMLLSSTLVQTFVALGVVHAVVASGATIRMTVAPVVRALIKRVPWRTLWLLVGFALTGVVVAMTTFSPPASRAAIVYAYDLAAVFFRKRRDFFTSNALSMAIIGIIQPEWLFDPGVIFSFAAAASIHVLPGLISSALFTRIKNLRVRRLFSKATALQVGVTPFVAFEFGQFPYFSLLINMFLYPVLEWTIPVCALLVLFACASPAAAAVLRPLLHPVFATMTAGLHVLSGGSLNVTFAPPPLWVQFLYLATMVFAVWSIRRYKLRKISKYSNG